MIIVNSWNPLTIIKKRSILDVAAVLDPLLTIYSYFKLPNFVYTEKAPEGLLKKKVFLQISQHLLENNCAKVSFSKKLQAVDCFYLYF